MKLQIPNRIKTWLIQTAMQNPYSNINEYMERYWLVPFANPEAGAGCGPLVWYRRPFGRLLQKFEIAARIHKIKLSDDARWYHDHPWLFITWLLFNDYVEVTPMYDESGIYQGDKRTTHKAGTILFRRAKTWHRLELIDDQPVWTLFITFRKQQRWGFLKNPDNKIYYRDYEKQ